MDWCPVWREDSLSSLPDAEEVWSKRWWFCCFVSLTQMLPCLTFKIQEASRSDAKLWPRTLRQVQPCLLTHTWVLLCYHWLHEIDFIASKDRMSSRFQTNHSQFYYQYKWLATSGPKFDEILVLSPRHPLNHSTIVTSLWQITTITLAPTQNVHETGDEQENNCNKALPICQVGWSWSHLYATKSVMWSTWLCLWKAVARRVVLTYAANHSV